MGVYPIINRFRKRSGQTLDVINVSYVCNIEIRNAWATVRNSGISVCVSFDFYVLHFVLLDIHDKMAVR